MSQQGTAGKKKQNTVQSSLGVESVFDTVSQPTAVAPEISLDPSVSPTFVDTGAQESLLAPGTLDPIINTAVQEPLIDPSVSTTGNPEIISATDPIFDTSGQGV